jgi:D-aminoacyl-tRNA deacylase
MNFALIASKKDLVGINCVELLINEFGFKETEKEFDLNPVFEKNNFSLYQINEIQIYPEIFDSLKEDILVFLSKHSAKSGKPSLTVHAVGNWSKAEFGGKDFTLVNTSGSLIKNYFLDLIKRKKEFSLKEHEVSLESTHHGPFTVKPTVFIELGSNEKHWNNIDGARALCETVMNASKVNEKAKAVIGFGGTHYCSEFNKLLERTDYCTTHIAPLYALENLNSDLISQALNKSIEKVELAVLDWKGLRSYKEKVVELLKENKIGFERIQKLI